MRLTPFFGCLVSLIVKVVDGLEKFRLIVDETEAENVGELNVVGDVRQRVARALTLNEPRFH